MEDTNLMEAAERGKNMLQYTQEFIGIGVAGMLSWVWFDLRKLPDLISKWKESREDLKKEILAEIGTRIDDKDGGLMTRDKHADLCRIVTLEQNEVLLSKFGAMLDDKFRKNEFVRVP